MIIIYNVKRHFRRDFQLGVFSISLGQTTEDTLDPHGTTSNLENYFPELEENLRAWNAEDFQGSVGLLPSSES